MGGYKTLCQPTRPSLMTSATQFHVFLPWGKAPGEGPSRGLLCDCTTSPINRFAALDLTLPSLTPREVLILLLREVCSLSLAVSPASCASTRGVSARGLGVTPVSWTTDSESNVPGRRPWLQNTTLNILFVSYIIIFSIFCILEVCAVFAVHYIKKINKS